MRPSRPENERAERDEPISSSEEVPDFGVKTLDQMLFRTLEAAMWLAGVGCAWVAVMRLVFHDGAMLLIWLNSFTFYLYLPAYAALVFALVWRKPLLASLSLFAVAMHIYWVLPDYAKPASAASATRPDLTLKVFSANVLTINQDLRPVLDEIDVADPDVIVLQEYSPYAYRDFRAHGIIERYPHHLEQPESHSFGVAFFSRLPTKDLHIAWVDEVPFTDAKVAVGHRWVRIINVHTLPPRIPSYVAPWRSQLEWLTTELTNSSDALLMVGDFNATQHSLFYEEIKAAGAVNLHEALGRGSVTTYPNGYNGIPAIHLDHAFINRHLTPRSIREGAGTGSDHKSLIVEVKVPSPSP